MGFLGRLLGKKEPSPAASAFAAFADGSVEGLRMQTEAHAARWHLGKEANWSLDQDKGEIVWTFADGTVATAPAQIVGTYDASKREWMWAWNNSSVAPALRADAERTRDYGRDNNMSPLL